MHECCFFSDFYESFHPRETRPIYGQKASHASPAKTATIRTRYSSEDQALQCSACGKKYSLKHNLARHVRFECGGQRRFSCHLCPNKYTQNVSLRRHLTHHHNVVVPVKKRYNSPRKMYDRAVYQWDWLARKLRQKMIGFEMIVRNERDLCQRPRSA